MTRHYKALIALIVASVLFWCALTLPTAANRTSADGESIVVLLHGLGRGNSALWLLAHRLESAGFRVERVGYSSLRDPPEEILEAVGKKIADCCFGASGRVHFVGHSLGGLLIRAYLAKNRVANLGRVVLIGTPSNGTELVDLYRDKWWFQALGPTARALGTDANSFPMTLPAPDYALGVIAGRSTRSRNGDLLPGEDDGLVSVDSTKVPGMRDFVVVDAGHSRMRNNKHVADHTIYFLKTGRFNSSAR